MEHLIFVVSSLLLTKHPPLPLLTTNISDASKASSFHLQIYTVHRLLPNKCIGEIKDGIIGIIGGSNSPGSRSSDAPNNQYSSLSSFTRNLQVFNTKGTSQILPIVVNFSTQMEVQGTQSPLDATTRSAVLGYRVMPEFIVQAGPVVDTAVDKITTMTDVWTPLLGKLEGFSNLVDKVVEVCLSLRNQPKYVDSSCFRSTLTPRWLGQCFRQHTR